MIQVTFSNVGNDVLLEILSYLDIVSIVRFLCTSKSLYRLIHIITERFTVPYSQYISSKRWNQGLIIATSKGDFPQIQYFIEKGADGMNNGLYEAARLGNRFLVEFFIERGACRWNLAMEKSALGGHTDLVEYFISKGARNWRAGMIAACEGGHRDLIHYFMEKKGITRMDSEVAHLLASSAAVGGHIKLVMEFSNLISYDYPIGVLREASRGGYLDIVDYVLHTWNHNIYGEGLRMALEAACYGGHETLVERFLQQGAGSLYCALLIALEGGNQRIIDNISRKMYHVEKDLWNDGLKMAAKRGGDLINYCIQKGANDWDGAMSSAAEGGHPSVVEFFIEKGANDWNSGLISATTAGHQSLVEFFVHKGADTWNDCLCLAVQEGFLKMVEFFVQKGADDWTRALLIALSVGDLLLVKHFVGKGANWKETVPKAMASTQEDIVEFFQELENKRQVSEQ